MSAINNVLFTFYGGCEEVSGTSTYSIQEVPLLLECLSTIRQARCEERISRVERDKAAVLQHTELLHEQV